VKTLHSAVCLFCNFKFITFYDLQLLDAVMKLIEPTGRFNRTEVSSASVCTLHSCENEATAVSCYEI